MKFCGCASTRAGGFYPHESSAHAKDCRPYDGPPCGGCESCIALQVTYIEDREAVQIVHDGLADVLAWLRSDRARAIRALQRARVGHVAYWL